MKYVQRRCYDKDGTLVCFLGEDGETRFNTRPEDSTGDFEMGLMYVINVLLREAEEIRQADLDLWEEQQERR